MKTFSQRMGIEPVEQIFQREFVSDRVRTQVWNFLYEMLFEKYPFQGEVFLNLYWKHSCLALDERPDSTRYVSIIKKIVRESSWNVFFDFIEFLSSIEEHGLSPFLLSEEILPLESIRKLYAREKVSNIHGADFIIVINNILEKENSAYRIIGGFVQEITTQTEIEEIQNALDNNPYKPCRDHLRQALKSMSDRENPDFRNSIKESICAVEAVAKIVTNNEKATLGKAIKTLGDLKKIHSCQKDAFEKLYGWTCDEDGIRHAMMDEPNLTSADARYMLIVCSAFVNYLIDAFKDNNQEESKK